MPQYSGIWTEQAVMQAVGAGNWANVPGVPTGVTGTVLGATSVSVAFTAPTFAGIPATITSYTVTSSPGGITASGASSPITVTGLTTGTPYTFTVTATNASGTSSPSAASSSVTPVQIDYIEDVFSTYLYTGASASQTITNGIDLSTYGGLVVIKGRNTPTGSSAYGGAANQFTWQDTVRGITQTICSNRTDAQLAAGGFASNGSISSTGFTLDYNGYNDYNRSPNTYASWTFRKQAKFFDVVTYTGNGTNRTIAHNLGSVPGCIIVKDISTSNGYWAVYHRSTGANYFTYLNDTSAASTGSTYWNNTSPTSTVFTVGTNADVNASGVSYVAYVFAHDAGGFGLTGTDNVISCGSFTSDGSGLATINLGYEAQWVLIKNSGAVGDWEIYDTLRGMSYSSAYWLRANLSSAEANVGSNTVFPTATGFSYNGFAASQTGIYIAIRRGPMKVPTSGTSVFAPVAVTVPPYSITAGFPVDFVLFGKRSGANSNRWLDLDRLRGGQPALLTSSTASENNTYASSFASNTQFTDGWSSSGYDNVYECFQRAPGFFDVVCYTGNSTIRTINHNLGVAPELMIVKKRSAIAAWPVYLSATTLAYLNLTDAQYTGVSQWNSTAPTSTVFTVATSTEVNESGQTYVAYLFATCAGVSKVGSYTGTGALQTINCGFAAGARFVLIKRTDSTGDWWTYDSARGITSGNDPYLFLNSTAAEVTGTNYVDTTSVGFQVTAAAPAGLNASGGTYIFLAIA